MSKLHLLLHRETDDLIIVTEETYHNAMITDNEYVKLEYREQLAANGVTVERIMRAVEAYVLQGVQTALAFDFGANEKDETQLIKRAKESTVSFNVDTELSQENIDKVINMCKAALQKLQV